MTISSSDFTSLQVCAFLPVYLSLLLLPYLCINSHPHLMLGHLQSLQNLKVLLVLWKERGELIAPVRVTSVFGHEGLV